jgi:CRP-like cAMP-binding protein
MARRAPDRKLELLRNVWLFSGCSARELRNLGSATERVSIPDGTVIMAEGHPGRDLFVVIDGTATASINGRPIGSLGPGSFFGELALIDDGPRTATVVANGPIEALVLSRGHFNTLLDDTPSVARKMLSVMGARLREADRQLATG